MPSPRAVLHDIAEHGLDPSKAHALVPSRKQLQPEHRSIAVEATEVVLQPVTKQPQEPAQEERVVAAPPVAEQPAEATVAQNVAVEAPAEVVVAEVDAEKVEPETEKKEEEKIPEEQKKEEEAAPVAAEEPKKRVKREKAEKPAS